jgi:hypothetical protein
MEIWKDIEGYEGLYQVSSCGRIKSLARSYKFGPNNEKILKARKSRKGKNGWSYPSVALYKDNIAKFYTIHRLVAIHFIPNLENKPQVNHKDGNKLNNNINNLEWATQSENSQHAWDSGLNNEVREKIRKWNTGKKLSDETKQKMSNRLKGKKSWNKGMTKQQEYEYRLDKKNTIGNLVGMDNKNNNIQHR